MAGLALGLAAAGGAGPSPLAAQTDPTWLTQSLTDWYAGAARVAPGTWGVAVADQSGRILWEVNKDTPLVPASTVKLLTTGFARTVLGGDARRPTRVVGNGRVNPGTGEWLGTWALELNGDPTLERGEGKGPTLYDLALQLRQAGVRRITGPLKVLSSDGPAVSAYPSVWSARHQGRLFAPLIGPLTLNENVVWLTVAPGSRPGAKARIVGASPQGLGSLVTMKATTRSGRRTSLRLLARGDGGWIVTGKIGMRSGSRRFAAVARSPKAVLSAAWASALSRAGISWVQKGFPAPKNTPATPRVLAEVTSPPLDSVASEVNRRSLNIGAELLLQWAGGRDGASARLTEHVREVSGDPEGAYLVDGSGLSGHDRVKPATFVSYLAKFPTTSAGRNFPLLLPANGTGTLRRLNSGLPGSGVVRAKTGTLNNVSTVVGYLGRSDGVLLVSLMYNGSRTWAARQEQWKLFRLLGADGVVIESDPIESEAPAQLGGEIEGAEAAEAEEAREASSTNGAPATAAPAVPNWWPAPSDPKPAGR